MILLRRFFEATEEKSAICKLNGKDKKRKLARIQFNADKEARI
jgi:hypothetical protein